MGSKAWAGETEATGLATHKTLYAHLANSPRMCSLRRHIKKDRKTLEPQTKRKQHYLDAADRLPALRAQFPQVFSLEGPPLRKGEGREAWGGFMVRRTARTRNCENGPAVSNRTHPHPGKDANLRTSGSPSPPKPVTPFSQSWLFRPRGAFVASQRGSLPPTATVAPATSILPPLVRGHWLAGWEGLQWSCLTLQGNHKQGSVDIMFFFWILITGASACVQRLHQALLWVFRPSPRCGDGEVGYQDAQDPGQTPKANALLS